MKYKQVWRVAPGRGYIMGGGGGGAIVNVLGAPCPHEIWGFLSSVTCKNIFGYINKIRNNIKTVAVENIYVVDTKYCC